MLKELFANKNSIYFIFEIFTKDGVLFLAFDTRPQSWVSSEEFVVFLPI